MEQTDDDQPVSRAEKLALRKAEAEKARKARLALKGEYLNIAKTKAFRDLQGKIASFDAYHLKLAKDGVGYEQMVMSDGSTTQKTVRFTPEERAGHLDRSAGIQEIADYIERMLKLETQDEE